MVSDMDLSFGDEIGLVPQLAGQLTTALAYRTSSSSFALPIPLEIAPAPQQRATPHYIHRVLRDIDSLNMALPELCDMIPQFATLDKLKIMASECFVTHTIVRHRYLILELRDGKSTAWMRIDRRRPLTHILAFFLRASGGPANDTVVVSLKKENLIDQNSTRENRQECGVMRTVTLGEMRHFFALLIRELRHYHLHDANCWLFASAIQHYLQHQAKAEIVSGRIAKSNWAVKTRTRLMSTLDRLYNISNGPLLLTDLNRQLDACATHPRFTTQVYFIPIFRWVVESLKENYTESQSDTPEIPIDRIRDFLKALKAIDIRFPPSVQVTLAGIGLLLAQSCPSLVLALPAALAVQAKQLYQTHQPESISLVKDSLVMMKERRRQADFLQQHREFCELWPMPFEEIIEMDEEAPILLEDLRSTYLIGVETARRLRDMHPENCVHPLIEELRQYAKFLKHLRRFEEGCEHLAQAVQAAKDCKCSSRCRYMLGHSSGDLAELMESYAFELMDTSHVDEALEQYKATIDAAPSNEKKHRYVLEYADALIDTERIDESYTMLQNYVPNPDITDRLADIAKDLSRHPNIRQDYEQQLHMLSESLSWLETDHSVYDHDEDPGGLRREVLWDYANVLATLGRFQASEDAFANLVKMWRGACESEWYHNATPRLVSQWYFLTLETFANVLDVNGKASDAQSARKSASTILHQHALKHVCASELDRPFWRVEHDEDDPQFPPTFLYTGNERGKARPAFVVPLSLSDEIQTAQNT